MFLKCSASVLRCSPRLCSWTTTVYAVYHFTKLTYYSHKLDHHLQADDIQIYIADSIPDSLKLWTIAYQTLSSGESSYLFSMIYLAPKSKEFR